MPNNFTMEQLNALLKELQDNGVADFIEETGEWSFDPKKVVPYLDRRIAISEASITKEGTIN